MKPNMNAIQKNRLTSETFSAMKNHLNSQSPITRTMLIFHPSEIKFWEVVFSGKDFNEDHKSLINERKKK